MSDFLLNCRFSGCGTLTSTEYCEEHRKPCRECGDVPTVGGWCHRHIDMPTDLEEDKPEITESTASSVVFWILTFFAANVVGILIIFAVTDFFTSRFLAYVATVIWGLVGYGAIFGKEPQMEQFIHIPFVGSFINRKWLAEQNKHQRHGLESVRYPDRATRRKEIETTNQRLKQVRRDNEQVCG